MAHLSLGISAAKHLHATETHEEAADRHDRLAAEWHAQGDTERAALELRVALYARELALLERELAELDQRGDRTFDQDAIPA